MLRTSFKISILLSTLLTVAHVALALDSTPVQLASNCFPAGTKISINKNGETRNIEDLKPGDTVLSFNEALGGVTQTEVLFNKASVRLDTYTIFTSDGNQVETTSDHPFFVGNAYRSLDPNIPFGYKKASDLHKGDKIFILDVDSQSLVPTYVSDVIVLPKRTTVYSIGVSKNANFFANNYAVHNKSPCPIWGCGNPPPPPKPPKPWTCFPAGTKILMSDSSEKNIEDVAVGDSVMSYDGKNKTSATVLELESPVRDHLYKLVFKDGSSVRLTAEHPLFTDQGWKSILPEKTAEENPNLIVGNIALGDNVFNKDGIYVTLTSIEYIPGNVQTYNLRSVSKNNNFYADSFLAHNKGGGDPPPPPPPPPPQNFTQGRVWEDINGNGRMDYGGKKGDKFWGQLGNGACASNLSSGLQVADTAGGTSPFTCVGGLPTYTTPTYVSRASKKFNLTPPNGIACSVVVWDYTVCENSACTAAHSGSGTGCTATIANYSGSYTNTLNWRVGQLVPRLITGDLYKTANTSTCVQDLSQGSPAYGAFKPLSGGSGTIPGLTVSAYDGAIQKGTRSNVSYQQVINNSPTGNHSNSSYRINGLYNTDNITTTCINGSLVDNGTTYQLACVKGTGVTCVVGSGTCAVNCIVTAGVTTGKSGAVSSDIDISFGFTPMPHDKWLTVLDGDIYSNSVSAEIAASPLGGFSPYLINTQTGSSLGGFGFASTLIDTQTTGTDASEKGGSAERLSILPSYPPTDQWLHKFSFSVPAGAITSVPSGNTFEEGKVYSFTTAQFNQILNSGSYKFASGNSNSPAASVVYVTGSGSIDINKNFVSSNADKTLLVVTTADVNVSIVPGTTTASYTATGASQIDLALISQKDINFASQYNESNAKFDTPLMVYGALMSSGTINFDRNLGNAGNSNYPATTVRFYPYLMSLIQQYELTNMSADGYTGLATVDVQFDYGQ